MNEGLIPRRYAKALYKVALEKGVDRRVYELMKTLSESFATNPGLQTAIANPFVEMTDKRKLIMTASGAGNDDTLVSDFVKLLERNRRIEFIRDIATAYVEIFREKHGIYLVHVDTASEMTAADAERLRNLISRHLGEGATMEYSTSVVPELIGGFRVSVGNERLDASIAHELNLLKQKLII